MSECGQRELCEMRTCMKCTVCIVHMTSSASWTNPWTLYRTAIQCSDGGTSWCYPYSPSPHSCASTPRCLACTTDCPESKLWLSVHCAISKNHLKLNCNTTFVAAGLVGGVLLCALIAALELATLNILVHKAAKCEAPTYQALVRPSFTLLKPWAAMNILVAKTAAHCRS